jgi:hypothetical protein
MKIYPIASDAIGSGSWMFCESPINPTFGEGDTWVDTTESLSRDSGSIIFVHGWIGKRNYADASILLIN